MSLMSLNKDGSWWDRERCFLHKVIDEETSTKRQTLYLRLPFHETVHDVIPYLNNRLKTQQSNRPPYRFVCPSVCNGDTTEQVVLFKWNFVLKGIYIMPTFLSSKKAFMVLPLLRYWFKMCLQTKKCTSISIANFHWITYWTKKLARGSKLL